MALSLLLFLVQFDIPYSILFAELGKSVFDASPRAITKKAMSFLAYWREVMYSGK